MMFARLLFLCSLGLAVPAQAQPVAPSGEQHAQLGTALALGDMCGGYRPYEYHFLFQAWRKQWLDSPAATAITEKANAVNIGPMGFVEANRVRLDSERAVAQSYRQRATEIGCAKAAGYYNRGRVEAYLHGGTFVVQAIGMRGQAQVAPGMSALTADQRELVGAFGGQIQQLFGAQMPAFEREAGARAQALLAARSGLPPAVAAAFLESDQDQALSVIGFDGLFGPKKYSGQGVWLDDGTGFGRYAARLEVPDKTLLWRIADPKRIAAHPPSAAGAMLRGAMAVMLRKDGAAVVGLYEADLKAAGARVRVFLTDHRSPSIAATPFADCPVQQCFLVAANDLSKMLASAAPRLMIYATAGHAGSPHKDRGDGISFDRPELAALVAAVRK